MASESLDEEAIESIHSRAKFLVGASISALVLIPSYFPNIKTELSIEISLLVMGLALSFTAYTVLGEDSPFWMYTVSAASIFLSIILILVPIGLIMGRIISGCLYYLVLFVIVVAAAPHLWYMIVAFNTAFNYYT